MATTTNYSWTTPDDTALVKDGAAAIRSLGTAIDSTVFNNASAAIAKTIVDAKGDIIAATAADTVSRLAVGANDTVLTADSSTATGLKWAAPAGGGSNFTLLNTGGTALSGSATTTISGISGKDKIFILVKGASTVNAYSFIQLRLNTDSGGNYEFYGFRASPDATYDKTMITTSNSGGTDTAFMLGSLSSVAASNAQIAVSIQGANSSGVKIINSASGVNQNTGVFGEPYVHGGIYTGSSTISSISIISSSGNFDTGTVFVYTSAS